MENLKISFRRVTEFDIPNLVSWHSDEEVAKWWWDSQDEPRDTAIQRWAESANASGDKTDRYIITVNDEDIGEIQDCVLADYPNHAAEVGIDDSASVDMLIGVTEWRNRGVGTAVLASFVDEIVFRRPGIKTCTIDPEPRNKRAIRCYEKVGFRYVRTFHSTENNANAYLMRLDRTED